jgi:hypothetical protein
MKRSEFLRILEAHPDGRIPADEWFRIYKHMVNRAYQGLGKAEAAASGAQDVEWADNLRALRFVLNRAVLADLHKTEHALDSGNRDAATIAQQRERDTEIRARAEQLRAAGKTRGLAAAVKRIMHLKLSEKQVANIIGK